MNKERNNLRVLLIQLRSDDSQPHEVKAILKHAQLKPNQLIPYDALTKPVTPNIADGFDAVIIGGSGECNVSKGQPENITEIEKAVRTWVKEGIPFLGICYGGHILAKALGGKVVFAPERKELGNSFLYLKAAAQNDPLFTGLPTTFPIGVGHKDRIETLPPNTTSLAHTDLVQHHAFRVNNKLAYGVQFHPELDKPEHMERMRSVFKNFKHYYKSEADLQRHMDELLPTPESSSLLKKFIDLVAKEK